MLALCVRSAYAGTWACSLRMRGGWLSLCGALPKMLKNMKRCAKRHAAIRYEGRYFTCVRSNKYDISIMSNVSLGWAKSGLNLYRSC